MFISSPLYVICDADACRRAGWTLIDFASACLDGGARLLQVRAKAEPSGRLLDETLAIVERAAGAAQVIVNDRADVARLAGAAGVHVGQEDLSPVEVRSILGERGHRRMVHAHDAPARRGVVSSRFLTSRLVRCSRRKQSRPATMRSACHRCERLRRAATRADCPWSRSAASRSTAPKPCCSRAPPRSR